jgi:uncharacterized membrane protein
MKVKFKLEKKRFVASCFLASIALTLESMGVYSKAYTYGTFPFKLLGVPLSVIVGWVLVGFVAWKVSSKRGMIIGVLSAYAIDLFLEPLAFYAGMWTWTNSCTAQIYFGSTIGNLAVWILMCCLGIKLYSKANTEGKTEADVRSFISYRNNN